MLDDASPSNIFCSAQDVGNGCSSLGEVGMPAWPPFRIASTVCGSSKLSTLALAKTTPIEGPAGVEASFHFHAAFNATATRMITAVLRNQQAAFK